MLLISLVILPIASVILFGVYLAGYYKGYEDCKDMIQNSTPEYRDRL